MTWIMGGSHFVSLPGAQQYYRQYGYNAADVRCKLDEGLISIGRPQLIDGAAKVIVIKAEQRYGWLMESKS